MLVGTNGVKVTERRGHTSPRAMSRLRKSDCSRIRLWLANSIHTFDSSALKLTEVDIVLHKRQGYNAGHVFDAVVVRYARSDQQVGTGSNPGFDYHPNRSSLMNDR